jgi:hypothetical protein
MQNSGQFVYVIRKRIKLSPEKAIFIFVDEVLPPTAALMSSIYEEYKDEDGFLYITYSGENVCIRFILLPQLFFGKADLLVFAPFRPLASFWNKGNHRSRDFLKSPFSRTVSCPLMS